MKKNLYFKKYKEKYGLNSEDEKDFDESLVAYLESYGVDK